MYKSYPEDRINTQVIYRFMLAQVKCIYSSLISKCKHSITSLSLLVGTTVHAISLTPYEIYHCKYQLHYLVYIIRVR